jgi:hypothetical protein
VDGSRLDPRQALVEYLAVALDGWTEPTQALDLGKDKWLPDLIGPDKALLHLALEEIEDPWARRMEAASAMGYSIHVACVSQALTVENLCIMQGVEARPLLIDDVEGELQHSTYESVADLVARYELSLTAEGLRSLAEPLLSRARSETGTYRKGLLFEQVLCLLFSQTSYFRVLEHRYVGETEEIDIVLGNRATDELAELLGCPLVLVSGKNEAKAVGAPEVRELRGNMANRRGRCTFGILASANTVARTANTERIRATTDPSLVVAILGGSAIDELLSGPNLDQALRQILLAAVMD